MAEKRDLLVGNRPAQDSGGEVRVKAGSGKFPVNDRDMANTPNIKDRKVVLAPLSVTEQGDKVDVLVVVEGPTERRHRLFGAGLEAI